MSSCCTADEYGYCCVAAGCRLEKKGARRTDGWKKRWFELRGSTLVRASPSTALSNKPFILRSDHVPIVCLVVPDRIISRSKGASTRDALSSLQVWQTSGPRVAAAVFGRASQTEGPRHWKWRLCWQTVPTGSTASRKITCSRNGSPR